MCARHMSDIPARIPQWLLDCFDLILELISDIQPQPSAVIIYVLINRLWILETESQNWTEPGCVPPHFTAGEKTRTQVIKMLVLTF